MAAGWRRYWGERWLDMTATRNNGAMRTLNKVPEVKLYFWVINIMATTVGETAADLLNTKLGLGLTKTSLLMSVLLISALVLQVRTRKYVPWVYWVAVVLISVVGTLITDNITDHFHVPLQVTTAIFAAALAAVFAVWCANEKTLSITTFGDLLSQPKGNGGFGLGTVGTSVLFLVVITALIVYLTTAQRKASAAMPLDAGMQGK